MVERDVNTLSELADDLFNAVEPIEDLEDIQQKVALGGGGDV